MSDIVDPELVERLLKWSASSPAPPIRIEMEPTDRCNLNCSFCWRGDEERLNRSIQDPKKEISHKRLIDAVKESAQLGVKIWRIGGGGEPMVRRETVLEMMKMIKGYGMEGHLTTNGSLFRKEDIEMITDVSWDLIEFSIDAPFASLHNQLRGRDGTFERAVAALEEFKLQKKKKKSKKPVIAINTVLLTENYKLIPDMIEMCRKYSVEVFSLNPVTVFSEAGRRLKLPAEKMAEFQPFLFTAIEKAKKYQISNSLIDFQDLELVKKTGEMREVLAADVQREVKPNSADSDNDQQKFPQFFSVPCFMPWYIMVIRGGMVGPCSGFEGKFNSLNDGTLSEIWNGEILANFRKRLQEMDLPEFCDRCSGNMMAEHRRIRGQLQYHYQRLSPQEREKIALKKYHPPSYLKARLISAVRRIKDKILKAK